MHPNWASGKKPLLITKVNAQKSLNVELLAGLRIGLLTKDKSIHKKAKFIFYDSAILLLSVYPAYAYVCAP